MPRFHHLQLQGRREGGREGRREREEEGEGEGGRGRERGREGEGLEEGEVDCQPHQLLYSVCKGNEQRSSVQNITLQSKKKHLIFLMCSYHIKKIRCFFLLCNVKGSVTFDKPCLSDVDCVNMQITFLSVWFIF